MSFVRRILLKQKLNVMKFWSHRKLMEIEGRREKRRGLWQKFQKRRRIAELITVKWQYPKSPNVTQSRADRSRDEKTKRNE